MWVHCPLLVQEIQGGRGGISLIYSPIRFYKSKLIIYGCCFIWRMFVCFINYVYVYIEASRRNRFLLRKKELSTISYAQNDIHTHFVNKINKLKMWIVLITNFIFSVHCQIAIQSRPKKVSYIAKFDLWIEDISTIAREQHTVESKQKLNLKCYLTHFE